MKKLSIAAAFVCVALSAGCSSSNDNNSSGGNMTSGNSTGGNSVENTGETNGTVGNIATADVNSSPATLNVEELQQTLDSIAGRQPVPVEDSDTAGSLLNKAGL